MGYGIWDMMGFGVCTFCFGLTCGYAYFKRVFLDPFDALRFSSPRRNEVLEQAASYIERLQGPRGSDFYAAAVREMKGDEQ